MRQERGNRVRNFFKQNSSKKGEFLPNLQDPKPLLFSLS